MSLAWLGQRSHLVTPLLNVRSEANFTSCQVSPIQFFNPKEKLIRILQI